MGIFSKDKKVKTVDTRPPVTKTAQSQIEDFIKANPFGTVPDLPTREIEGLSPLQKELQRLASQQTTGGDFDISSGVFRDAAQADTDVATSKEFEAFRRQIGELETEQQTSIRQGAELGGQLRSSPRQALESENVRKFDTALLQEFARLQRQNQQDKISAAAGLSELGTRRLGDIAAMNQIADQERAIEQARNDAVYTQALDTILFPYREALNLFSLATGQRPFDVAVTGGGATDLGVLAGLVGGFAGTEAGAGAIGKIFS